jgi:hypothetical protein
MCYVCGRNEVHAGLGVEAEGMRPLGRNTGLGGKS